MGQHWQSFHCSVEEVEANYFQSPLFGVYNFATGCLLSGSKSREGVGATLKGSRIVTLTMAV